MGKQLCAALRALALMAGVILLSATASAQDRTGPALVTSGAREILQLRHPPTTSDAWVFPLKITTTRSGTPESSNIVITVSDENYTSFETQRGLSIIDHQLKRVFTYHKDSKSFTNGSISEAAMFAVWEWQNRARIVQMNAVLMKSDSLDPSKMPMLSDLFWVSHDLGLKLPNAPDDSARVTGDEESLRLYHKDDEIAVLALGEQGVPEPVLKRVWGVLQRVRPVHPSLAAQAIAHGGSPQNLRTKLFLGEKPYFVELTFDNPTRASRGYPLPEDAALRSPRPGGAGAEMIAIALKASAGEFAPGQPGADYWITKFRSTLAKDKSLETFLTFYAYGLFTADFRAAECGERKTTNNTELCSLVQQALARSQGRPRIRAFFEALQPADEKAKIAAIGELEDFREEAGEMAPLISLFIANHIEDLTKVITRTSGEDGRPNRDDAATLYLEALREYPFIRSVYGDIAEYYINFFVPDQALFYADIGRSLPLGTAILENGNLARLTRIEQSTRTDFPLFY